jgi:hypothetical protein
MATVAQRMDKHTDKTDPGGCWVWTAYRNQKGYGQIQVDNHPHRTHRVAWSLANGPIPEGMSVLHSCDNPACVNPAHLHLGTVADNNQERCERGRSYKPIGEANFRAKLTEQQVLEIRTRYALGGVFQRELADEYGVCRSLIGHIITRHLWTHI